MSLRPFLHQTFPKFIRRHAQSGLKNTTARNPFFVGRRAAFGIQLPNQLDRRKVVPTLLL
jgi:hypothetical protein